MAGWRRSDEAWQRPPAIAAWALGSVERNEAQSAAEMTRRAREKNGGLIPRLPPGQPRAVEARFAWPSGLAARM